MDGLGKIWTKVTNFLDSREDPRGRLLKVAKQVTAANPDYYSKDRFKFRFDPNPQNGGAQAHKGSSQCEVTVGAGLFQQGSPGAVKNNDELALVVAHEFDHCVNKDQDAVAQKAKELGVAEDSNNPQLLAFKRSLEMRADRNALQRISQAKFNPGKAVEVVEREIPGQQQAIANTGQTASFIEDRLDHPLASTRAAALKRELPQIREISHQRAAVLRGI